MVEVLPHLTSSEEALARRASARAGAIVGRVPRHTFSFWNLAQIHRRLSAGLGLVQRAGMFATIDNTVTLPGYVKADERHSLL